MSLNDEELAEFRTEARELLESTEASLLALESGGDFKSNFDSIFRVFHNLKGTSGMLGLVELGKLMHHLENLLNSTSEIQVVSKEQIEEFLKGVDSARVLLGLSTDSSTVDAGEAQAEISVVAKDPVELTPSLGDGVAEFLTEGQEILQRSFQELEKIEKEGLSDHAVDSLYRDVHTLKGGAYLFKFKQLGDLTHSIETVLEGLRQHYGGLTKPLLDCLYDSLSLAEKSMLKIQNNSTEDFTDQIVRAIDILNLLAEESGAGGISSSLATPVTIAPAAERVEPVVVAAAPPIQHPAQSPAQHPAQSPAQSMAPSTAVPHAPAETDKDSANTIRVPVVLLDKLMTLMGEMVLVRNQVIQYSNRTDDLEFLNLSQRLNVVTGEIQGEMMKTRMQPIGNVLTKFTRLTRELSKELGKKIELRLSGSETELDKTLLEAVKDPLTHIVRNSCDHGIESPAERKAAGKSEVGSISINSYHEGGQVIIEIADDGKGLHRDRLLKKAIEKGIVLAERASALSDQEIVHLIFAPGFSTALKVTNVSGRGVGMDVVRTNIEKIGGSVEIQSEPGRGTTLRLKIPLTLAIVPALIVRCENDFFAIPQLKLVELVRVDQSSSENRIERIQGHPVFRLRGNILPLINIRKVLYSSDATGDQPDVANIVVLKSDQYCFGLIVDEIQDTADIVVKPLARFLKSIGVYSGATVLGDGAIALILDVAGIVKEHISTVGGGGPTRHIHDSDISKQSVEDLQDFLLLRVGAAAKHAILLGYVHRLEEFKKSAVEVSGHRRLVRYRNLALPLISLNQALGLDTTVNSATEVISVVVIEKGGSLFGLEVNEILDVLTTPSVLDTTVTTPGGVIGNLITDDEIVVVIDPYKLIQSMIGLEVSTTKRASKNIVPQSLAKLPAARSSRPVRNILYVEDAAFFRRHVSKALQSAGYVVIMANNGKEACELLEKSDADSFDLILSDIEMPQMNGIEFAKAVRRSTRWAHVPLIALSTRSNQRIVEEGYQAGFNVYLEKMNAEELIQTIVSMSERGVA